MTVYKHSKNWVSPKGHWGENTLNADSLSLAAPSGSPSLGAPRNLPYSDWGHMKVIIPWSHNLHFAFDPFSSWAHLYNDISYHLTHWALNLWSVKYIIIGSWTNPAGVTNPESLAPGKWQPEQGWFHGVLKWEWTYCTSGVPIRGYIATSWAKLPQAAFCLLIWRLFLFTFLSGTLKGSFELNLSSLSLPRKPERMSETGISINRSLKIVYILSGKFFDLSGSIIGTWC